MIITKLGHCCLVIQEQGSKILTDPGDYTTTQVEVTSLAAVLITHEHADHLHVPSLTQVVRNNPGVRVITNRAVGEVLAKAGMAFEVVEHDQEVMVGAVKVEGYGEKHAHIYETVKDVVNTGYFINGKLFYPGDAFYNPGRAIDVLALPVDAPWLVISEPLRYALELAPRIAFPVHDGGRKRPGVEVRLPGKVLPEHGVQFVVPELGVPFEV